MNVLELPFNQYVGLSLCEEQGEEVLCLESQGHHENHLGTVHASALYSLAEAASGHCLLNQSEVRPEDYLVMLRSSSVKYRKPARGRIIAQGSLSPQAAAKFTDQLTTKDQATVNLFVELVGSEGEVVFTGEFTWFAIAKDGAAE